MLLASADVIPLHRVHENAYLTAALNYLAGSRRPVLATVGVVIPIGRGDNMVRLDDEGLPISLGERQTRGQN
jgi:hypothetical protein